MAKQTGLGDNLYIGAFNISNDVQSAQIHGGPAALDNTGIDKSAYERIGGLRTGQMSFVAFLNDAAGQEHPALSTLPTSDVIVSYFHGAAIGNSAASCVGKQIGYDGTRANDGQLTFSVDVMSNGFGVEWGNMLTAGRRTDTTATNGTGFDTGGSLSFGLQAYLHVFSFTGTSVTIKIQDSADNATFADVAGLTFSTVTGATSERIVVANTTTIRRYLRVVTSGTFSNVVFAVNANKNAIAGQVF